MVNKRNILLGFLGVLCLLVLTFSASVVGGWGNPFCPDPPDCDYIYDGGVPPPKVGGIGSGSGFVVAPNGYILTNHHVVEGANSIEVVIDGNVYEAQVVSILSDHDAALLKVPGGSFDPVTIGGSDDVQVGDSVLAIGCPAGICGTITQGRVANLHVSKENYIMMDLTVTHGNSGGPVLNNRGEVVGIATAVLAPNNQETGFSFAIPIDDVESLLQRAGTSTTLSGNTANLSFEDIVQDVSPSMAYVETDQFIPVHLPSRYDTWSPDGRTFDNSDWRCCIGCYLDDMIPTWGLLGYTQGIADQHEMTRGYPGTSCQVTFRKEIRASITQLGSETAAQQLVNAWQVCPEKWGTQPGSETTTKCLDYRTNVCFSSRDTYRGASITRQLSSSVNPDIRQDNDAYDQFCYSAIAQLGTYLVRMRAIASLKAYECDKDETCLIVWATSESGLYVRSGFIPGHMGPKTVVMSYDEFVDWSTSREQELLDYVIERMFP